MEVRRGRARRRAIEEPIAIGVGGGRDLAARDALPAACAPEIVGENLAELHLLADVAANSVQQPPT